MLLFCSSTTALGNVLLGDLLPKFFAPMVLRLLDFLPCQRKLTEGLPDLHSTPKGAPSHALRSPHNPSGTPCHLPLHRGGFQVLQNRLFGGHTLWLPCVKGAVSAS